MNTERSKSAVWNYFIFLLIIDILLENDIYCSSCPGSSFDNGWVGKSIDAFHSYLTKAIAFHYNRLEQRALVLLLACTEFLHFMKW